MIQDTLKLGLAFDQEINDVSVKLLSPFVFRPGFTNQVDVYLKNLSYNDRIIDFDLTLDDKVTLVNSSYAPYDVNGNEVSYKDLLLNGRGQKLITLTLETEVDAIIGDLISLAANIELKSFADNDPSNNSHVLSDTIRGSYDPNDKAVKPNEDIVYDQNVLDQELIYTIRFQNTGNYPADFVILRDTFENNLDPSPLDIMSYSHPREWQIKEGSVLEVTFPNINLPDSTVSEELSQGYVTFKLGLNSDISIGTAISNKASIYFDYNPPIVTPTIITNIVEPVSSTTDINQSFTIVPNPSNDYILLKDVPLSNAIYEFFDLKGKLISRGNVSTIDNSRIQVSHLPTGQYILVLKSLISKEIYSSSFVKI